ncbi:hypothetical protein F5Y04DRAFT_284518 [Hypomontagnella monticulosa]|nr:hypothetical protein F5Y04DRAFT_284518 [Hypomontagnella monticulosa]
MAKPSGMRATVAFLVCRSIQKRPSRAFLTLFQLNLFTGACTAIEGQTGLLSRMRVEDFGDRALDGYNALTACYGVGRITEILRWA